VGLVGNGHVDLVGRQKRDPGLVVHLDALGLEVLAHGGADPPDHLLGDVHIEPNPFVLVVE
jgi:hypothetical protein